MFVRQILGDYQGFSWLASISNGRCEAIAVPSSELENAVDWLFQKESNLYVCMNPTDSKIGRRQEFVSRSRVVYADLDEKIHWKDLKVEPSIVTETSPGRYQAFWIMETWMDPRITSDLSHRIAAYHDLDACWDMVRLMRIPGSWNYKYEEPFQVRVVHERSGLFRDTDFPYPEVKLKLILYNEELDQEYIVENVPKYQELDENEQARIDNYTKAAVSDEIQKLMQLGALPHRSRLAYHGVKGETLYGWEAGAMWVARGLTEIANAPWNTYTLENAYHDFMTYSPTDLKWTKSDNHAKWQSAINKNCKGAVRFRKFPNGEM